MESVVITWSFENWITIFLMVLIGFAALTFATKLVKGNSASN